MNFNEYQKETGKTVFGDNGKTKIESVVLWALGISGEAGEVADIIKKVWRGDSDLDSKKEDLKKEIGDVLWYLARLSDELGIEFNEIAETNIKKLNSRKERGTLRGDGDNR